MAIENRDFAWLRRTLCDEIEAVRNGTADHSRAKSVAALAATALKSVEVEAMLRQQQIDLKEAPQLGSLLLCAEQPKLGEQFPENGGADTTAPEKDEEEQEPTIERAQTTPTARHNGDKAEHEITEVSGFKLGDRVVAYNGHRGKVTKITTSGRIDVTEDTGGTFPYQAKYLSHEKAGAPRREAVKSPIVPPGPVPRFVAGKNASGSR